MCIVWEKRQRIQKAMSMWLTWCVTMREQDEEEDKHGGSQPVSWRGGGGRGWRRGGQGSRLKRYHSIAHLFLRQPGRVLYGLTCAGPHRQEGTERYEEGGGRARITINIQRGLRNHKQHRDRRELRDSHSAGAGRQSHKVKPWPASY